jgi:phospholipid/cholesterol/gamma-HCH transport system permease protein
MPPSSHQLSLAPRAAEAPSSPAGWVRPLRWVIGIVAYVLTIASLLYRSIASIFWEGRRGRRLSRRIFLQQIYFTAVQSAALTVFIAVAVGALLMHQASVILPKYGLPDYAEWITVRVLFREITPMIVALLVIARSANAIVIELGNMRVNGEIRALEVIGVNLDRFIVLPRITAMAISVVILTVLFCACGLWGGFWTADAMQLLESNFILKSLLDNFSSDVLFNILARALSFGVVIGAVACHHGLRVSASTTEVPQQAGRGVVRALQFCFVLNFIISLYLFTGSED